MGWAVPIISMSLFSMHADELYHLLKAADQDTVKTRAARRGCIGLPKAWLVIRERGCLSRISCSMPSYRCLAWVESIPRVGPCCIRWVDSSADAVTVEAVGASLSVQGG